MANFKPVYSFVVDKLFMRPPNSGHGNVPRDPREHMNTNVLVSRVRKIIGVLLHGHVRVVLWVGGV